jgi:hypothetical protein
MQSVQHFYFQLINGLTCVIQSCSKSTAAEFALARLDPGALQSPTGMSDVEGNLF